MTIRIRCYRFTGRVRAIKLISIINLSDQKADVNLNTTPFSGNYIELFTGTEMILGESTSLNLAPWGYTVLSNR